MSAPDPRVAVQLLRYLADAWTRLEANREAGDKLPAIVPMVVAWPVPPPWHWPQARSRSTHAALL